MKMQSKINYSKSISDLTKLKESILKYENHLYEALKKDLNKSEKESFFIRSQWSYKWNRLFFKTH
ncbi:hypothetical protein [Malacoplasma iowae]|uniref:hypothetical protein n=1 Tax=Malacoplasma iowae TaxID=2116 RepID=UPI00022C6432|nr:hypothetical protein [Malacoplasma iowae]EGZ30789.1 hypothetical protein GUU_00332 [Malacoplasma iowae 695]